jgi:hypothetical protein
MAEFLITLRPDLPHVKDLLLLSDVIYNVVQFQEAKTTIESGSVKELKSK